MGHRKWTSLDNGAVELIPDYCPAGVRVIVEPYKAAKMLDVPIWRIRIETPAGTKIPPGRWLHKATAVINAWRAVAEVRRKYDTDR